jgi:hypothetical protein
VEELLETVSGTPLLLGAAVLLAIPGVRRGLRPLMKAGIRVGLRMTDQVKNLSAEAREQMSDLYAEARAEREESPAGAAEPETT